MGWQVTQADSRSANGFSLLGRSSILNLNSIAPDHRYLRIVLRNNPVRGAILGREMIAEMPAPDKAQ